MASYKKSIANLYIYIYIYIYIYMYIYILIICLHHIICLGPQKITTHQSDCRQISFVTLSGFCPLRKPHPTALNGQYQDG